MIIMFNIFRALHTPRLIKQQAIKMLRFQAPLQILWSQAAQYPQHLGHCQEPLPHHLAVD